MLPSPGATPGPDPDGDDGSAEKIRRADPVWLECGYYDVEQVDLIAQMLLVTLGTACVEKTYGDPFNSPTLAVADVKKEMLEYLQQQQGGAFAAGSIVSFPTPRKMLEEVLDAFVRSKRNFFCRVSSKIINSEKKEDRIEDFVQELDRAGAWMIGHREVLAKTLLRRLDGSNAFLCQTRFESSEDLAAHKKKCSLRPVTCSNEGCGEVFSAVHAQAHDATCCFKLLPCEQKCEGLVMRGEMDKHCITACPMKLVNCPFYHVGCANTLPQGMVEQHCTELMGSHLLFVLQSLQKQEVSVDNVTQRAFLLEKALSISQRSEAVDVGTLSLKVREQEAKIRALEQEATKFRNDLKAIDVSAEILQLRNEVGNLKKMIETQPAAK